MLIKKFTGGLWNEDRQSVKSDSQTFRKGYAQKSMALVEYRPVSGRLSGNDFVGDGYIGEKRWMVYAVFLYMAGFSLPLLYYLRYSDRNKKIIQVMIHTRTCHISLYHRLFGIYQALLLTLAYTVVFIVLMLTHTVDRPDLYRLVSMPCCLLILNEFCMLCMKVIRRYAFAVLVYLLGVMFLFTTNQIGIGLFFPIHMENHCFSYFFGKIVELLILFAAHGSWDFLFGKRMK